MDEMGLLLLFSSFPCALLLIMLTDVAEQRQAMQATSGEPRRRVPMPVGDPRPAPQGHYAWDVRGFFKAREKRDA